MNCLNSSCKYAHKGGMFIRHPNFDDVGYWEADEYPLCEFWEKNEKGFHKDKSMLFTCWVEKEKKCMFYEKEAERRKETDSNEEFYRQRQENEHHFWSYEDYKKLSDLWFKEKMPIPLIAKLFKRTPASIEFKIKELEK